MWNILKWKKAKEKTKQNLESSLLFSIHRMFFKNVQENGDF